MKSDLYQWLMLVFISISATTLIQSQNNALNFDGVDDYVDCGNILPLSYTAEAWIYITDLSKANNIISGEDGSLHAFWAPTSSGTKLSAGHNGMFSEVEDPTPLVANTWYHVAVTYDATTTTMYLYKNGVVVSYNTTVQPLANSAAHVYIGNFNAGLNVFAGNIDEVRIWRSARTASDILTNMNASIATSQPNLIANYRCNQGIANGNNTSISSLLDNSGNNNHGILSGFTLTGSSSNFVGGSPVLSPDPLVVKATTPNPITCHGGTTTVTLTATGGTPPYSGIGTFTVRSGTYAFTATDGAGQSVTITGTITGPKAIVLSTPSVSNVSCNKDNDGQIEIKASGGTGNITFAINPDYGKQKTVGTFKKLKADIYNITATDAKGCLATTRVTITEPDGIDPDKCYSIINKKTGKVLDVFAGSRSNAARIIQNASNGSNNQKWRFISVGRGGNVKIVAQHCGKAVSICGVTNNAPVCQSRYASRGNEDWTLECLGKGFYKIINGRCGKVLDVQNASMSNSAQIVITDWDSNKSQQWQIVEATCPTKKRDRDDDENNLLSNQVASINGHAEAQRNVIGYTTNQGFRLDYLTVEKMNLLTNAFESIEISNKTLITDELQYQSFYDNTPDKGDNFYRIKQTYLNGDIAYSPVQMIKYQKGDNISIYPNPAIDEVWIDLKPFEGREVTLVLSDLMGRTIQQETVQKVPSASHRLDVNNIPTGLYLIKIHAQGKRVLMKKIQVTK